MQEPTQPEGIAPLKVLQRTDLQFIVYDPRQPLGRRTAEGLLFALLEEASAFARALAAGGAV